MPLERYNDRRKGPDIIAKLVQLSGTVIWLTVIAIFIVLGMAKPKEQTLFENLTNIQLHRTWNYNLLCAAFFMVVFLFLICIISLILSITRHKRKTDRFNPVVIIFMILSFVVIMLFLSFSLLQ
jgi:hypothetical protein